jgi:hypothetical protein
VPLARNGLALKGTRHAVGIEIRQTIDLCRSKKGQELRSNAEKFKVKIEKAWEEPEDGAARQEIRRFLQVYLSFGLLLVFVNEILKLKALSPDIVIQV